MTPKTESNGGTQMLGPDGQTLIRLTRLEVVMEGVRDDLTELKDDISDLRSELLKEMRASRVARTETVKLFLEPKVFVPVLVLAGLFIAAATGVGVSWGDLEVRGAEAAPLHIDRHDTHTPKKEKKRDGKHTRRDNS